MVPSLGPPRRLRIFVRQLISHLMGYMVVLHRHLWLTFTELKDADRRALLNAPVSPSGLFGDAVEAIVERFSKAQKLSRAMSHFLPCFYSSWPITSPACDVSPILWTDYACDSECGHPEGIPIALRLSSSS